ncbi:MAG: helix-turn-helix transcriptional regulator [Proteobacteria bacterium]|nr:helix-turn-helix transcriptional regulator [Pseudomonadota bacterium]
MPRLPFSYQETHRVVRQPGSIVHCSSETADWSSLFACICSEAPFEGSFAAVKDHLIVIPLDKPVRIARQIGGERQEQILLPGSVTITPGGADFAMQTSSAGNSYDTLHLYIRDESIREISRDMFGPQAATDLPPSVGIMDDILRAIAFEIRKMLMEPAPADRIYAESLSQTIAAHLARTLVSGRSLKADEPRKLTPQQCKRAIEYIEEYLGESLTLAGIAKAAGVSTGRLNNEFRRSMAIAPYQYVMNARVRRANALLSTSDLSLAEIALRCGFSNQQHMTRIVRRATGRTPGAIRRAR